MDEASEAPTTPVTGEHPVTAEALIRASDALTEHIAQNPVDVDALARLVGEHQQILRRQHSQNWITAIVAVVAALGAASGIGLALKVDHNARANARTREALVAFCEKTNDYNAEARDGFIALFPDVQDPARLQAIADVAWPHRDCTAP